MGNRQSRLVLFLAPIAVAVMLVSGCGSRANHKVLFAKTTTTAAPAATTSTAAIDPEAAKAEIKTVYETGLNGPNLKDVATTATRVEDPDNPEVQAILEAVATRPLFANVVGKINSVTLLDDAACTEVVGRAGCAEAELDIYLNASDPAPALPKYKVYAVFVDGAWKVAKATLCGLVQLEPTLPQCTQ
jgi:hypothetical protein